MKKKESKFSFEKFILVKLNNPKMIYGGTGDDTNTDTKPQLPQLPDPDTDNPNNDPDTDSGVLCGQKNLIY